MKTRTQQTNLKSTFCAVLSAAMLMVFASGGSLFAQSAKNSEKAILYQMTIDEVACVAKKPGSMDSKGDNKVAYYITKNEIVIVGRSDYKKPERVVHAIRQEEKLEDIMAHLEAPSVNLFNLYFAILEDTRSKNRNNRAQKLEG